MLAGAGQGAGAVNWSSLVVEAWPLPAAAATTRRAAGDGSTVSLRHGRAPELRLGAPPSGAARAWVVRIHIGADAVRRVEVDGAAVGVAAAPPGGEQQQQQQQEGGGESAPCAAVLPAAAQPAPFLRAAAGRVLEVRIPPSSAPRTVTVALR